METHGIRLYQEQREDAELHPAATRSAGAARPVPEPPCPIRTAFQRDRDRVIHSKAFRRLKHKTQVFIAPDGDHFRTRLTHTLEVTQVARTIARALRLNEDLVEAIGLAHDLGHTPFGHAGERALAEVFPGFRHNEQSLRVVDRIEKDGQGLNLTEAVRDGILRHSKPEGDITGELAGRPATPEAQVVKISDGIAYINHDLDDALRAGVVTLDEVPEIALEVLGRRHAERIDTLVRDVIATSAPYLDAGSPDGQVIHLSEPVRKAADALRDFLFARVYAPINEAEATKKAQRMVQWLYQHYVAHPEQVPFEFARALADDGVERVAADYVASMTDRYALQLFEELYVPRFWAG
ncbi:deoxyguanosinetriphosphate triphosphohydrolase [Sphaerobacter thermophilus]|uniref:Deoxyguanosinetriphosphate triphosphohydrolase-like protein n=1 Tax=Sphaerobacter thermophilus (strain ATCC 49802 / DSM 20745 / KCCM 41009 / NCIMB 13125 / S 6022) TaxID=479434 RepID=D1C7M1_SPHTD|nr:deoxyguanosinetriphosphate triphosphohydrolase [Sphaerobacter thermophilus]ACZ37854.1 deoxyguanosinetriphosphate triphosphohydrolase [Sphaerobacter thermophilus DSM 20745]